jgi:hypothetical protein
MPAIMANTGYVETTSSLKNAQSGKGNSVL